MKNIIHCCIAAFSVVITMVRLQNENNNDKISGGGENFRKLSGNSILKFHSTQY